MTSKERAAMQQALEVLRLTKNSHGIMLMSDPPKDAWRFHDVDLKLVAAIAALREALAEPDMNLNCKSVQARLATLWGYVKAEQAEQEPVAWIDLTGAEIGEVWAKHPRDFDKCVAIIEKFKEKNTNPVTAKEKPVAWMCSDPKLLGSGYSRFSECCAGVWNIPVYTAPVRTKDLTDEEIAEAVGSPLDEVYLADFRAVITADRSKNGIV